MRGKGKSAAKRKVHRGFELPSAGLRRQRRNVRPLSLEALCGVKSFSYCTTARCVSAEVVIVARKRIASECRTCLLRWFFFATLLGGRDVRLPPRLRGRQPTHRVTFPHGCRSIGAARAHGRAKNKKIRSSFGGEQAFPFLDERFVALSAGERERSKSASFRRIRKFPPPPKRGVQLRLRGNFELSLSWTPPRDPSLPRPRGASLVTPRGRQSTGR